MNKICGACGSEKRYDNYDRKYRRCDMCNTKHALNYYYKIEDKLLEKKINHHHNKDEFFSERNKN